MSVHLTSTADHSITNRVRDDERARSTPEDVDPSSTAWYAVWLRSNWEQRVDDQLSAKGFHTFLPTLPFWVKRTWQRPVRLPMFPGYLFVRDALDKERYIDLLKVRGIVRVLEAGWSRLTPIPDDEIAAIHTIAASDLPVMPHTHLSHGDRVRVIDGPLVGVEGIFIQDKLAKGRLVVSVDLVGRSVAVEMNIAAVEPCAPPVTRRG